MNQISKLVNPQDADLVLRAVKEVISTKTPLPWNTVMPLASLHGHFNC